MTAPDPLARRPRRGRSLALDVGDVRVGVAVSDELGAIATPLTMVRRGPADLDALLALVREWSAVEVVVGLPTGLSGREGPQAAVVRAFAAKLAARLGETPLVFWDERLTTAIAERSLIASGTSRAKRKQQIDAVAAAVLLQSYLDASRVRAEDTRTAARPEER